jgi:hypothetical protein
MIGLDLLGAGEGLSTQAIVVRVRNIDPAKLRAAVKAGPWGAALAPAVSVVDQFPKLALDLALPIATQELKKIGITAELAASDNPPPPRPPAETKAAITVGAVLGVLLSLGGLWVYHRLHGKG